jgi:sec-independent protein translocase protein TatA
MGFVSHWWIIGLLVVVLIIFGPGKLPQIGGAVGTAIKEFRKATTELKDEVTRSTSPEPVAGPVTPVTAAPLDASHGVVADPSHSTVVDPVQKDKPELPKA